MNRGESTRRRPGQPAQDGHVMRRLRVEAARRRAVAAAEAAAAAQEQAAITMERLADLNAPDAARLRGMSIAARQRAARRRNWAREHAGIIVPTPRDNGDDMTVVSERDRIADRLQDTTVRRVFTVGLTLHGAAQLTTEPEVRCRIEAAIDELDQVVREIREAVFSAGGHRQGQELLDLGGRLAPAADICFTGAPGSGIDPVATARLRERLYQTLALISEYATPTRVDIVADDRVHELVIEAVCLSPAIAAGRFSRWLADVQAKALQAGTRVAVHPDGNIRLCSRVRSARAPG